MAKAKRGSLPEMETVPPEDELDVVEPDPIPLSTKEENLAPTAEPPKVALPGVRLEVFLRLAGRKPDQLAGFVAHARLAKLGPMPVANWRAALDDFDRKPTR